MKKVSLRVMAAITMGLAVVGCSHDSDSYMPSNEEQLANATEKLGVEVDPNQDWNMTSTAKASITVNGEYGETYIVKILANDPLVDGFSYVLAEGELANGETFTSEFEYASADKSLIVALTNHNGYTTYRSLPVVDGVMEATIGDAGTRANRRSQAEPSVGHITIPNAAYVNKYLEGAKEPTDANAIDSYDNGYYQGGSTSITTDPVLPGVNLGNLANTFVNNYNAIGDWFHPTEEEKNFFDGKFKVLWEAYNAMLQKLEWSGKGKVETHNAAIDKFIEMYNAVVAFAGKDGVSNWLNINGTYTKGAYTETGGTYVEDETYVLKFKVEAGKSWDKGITV
ncbi:MAG: hypothetical protein K2O54_00970, partial [Prevotella sp.]|nr:hypothetical protein [Prevotella sp.]